MPASCTSTLVRPGVALLFAGLLPAQAWADTPNCSDISGGAPILYGAGGSAQRDLVGKISTVLQNSSTHPIHLVYKDDAGACSGINALAGLSDLVITGTATYWDNAGSKATCNLALTGDSVDYAIMGNSPLLCPLVTDASLVDGIVDLTGPVSSVNVLVPNASTQQSISAEAFYLVYGFNEAAGIAPWTNPDPAYYIHRNENSFVQIYLSVATGLPVTKFSGTDAGSNSNTVAYLSALVDPEAGIGFASGDVADANRSTVRTLAWQQTGQTAGYWPDSTVTSFDKANIRNGQYFLWGFNHIYGLEGSSSGSFADPDVKTLIEYFAGLSQPAGTTQNITDTAISNKNVPVCAMQVNRDGDLGDIYAWKPPEPCGCYFDFKATGTTSCTTCDDATPCSGTDVCRYGYCEAY